MVMKANQKGEEGELSLQPSDGDSSNNQETSFAESDLPSHSESSCILEDKTLQSPNSEPKHSGVTAPLAELALLNRSIFVPSVALQAVENSQDGVATACLSFNHVRQIPTCGEPEPDPSPSEVHRRRGRPRKNPGTPVRGKAKRTVVEDTSKSVSESETSVLVEEKRSEKITLEVTKTRAKGSPGVVSGNPVPVRRARGRPPKKKKKSAQLWSPPVMQAGSSPSKSNEDSPVRHSRSFKSPDTKPKKSTATTTSLRHISTSRPLTRGALGKDFPSAKKRSWIDVERELEPELESE